MNEKQIISYIERNSGQIAIDSVTGSDISLSKIKKEVFVPKQKISVIRKWFKILPTVTLTDEELEITKKIVVKPKSSEWPVILTILKNQTMNDEKVTEWYKSIHPSNKLSGAMQCIQDERVKDDEYKIELFKEMLNHYNYQIGAIDLLDEEIGEDQLWIKMLRVLVDIINEDDERSHRLAEYWSENTIYLDIHTKEEKMNSTVLFKYTEMDHYLPQEAQDIFFI